MEEDFNRYVLEILQHGDLMSLATSDAGGLWVAPVCYVSHDLDIYWASHILSRHSRALERNPLVAACISLEDRDGEKAVQIAGLAHKIGFSDVFLSLYKTKRRKTKEYTLPEGYAWYMLEVSLLDLIYEPVFGRKKAHILPLHSRDFFLD